jgi:hypothetical protein
MSLGLVRWSTGGARAGPRRGRARVLIVLTAPAGSAGVGTRTASPPNTDRTPANRRLWNRISSAYSASTSRKSAPHPGCGTCTPSRRAPGRPGRRHRQARPRARLRRRPAVQGARRRGCQGGPARPVRSPTRRSGPRDESGPLPASTRRRRTTPLHRRPLRPGALRLRRLSRAPPHLAVPQAARVLGRGERLVFNVASQPTHPTAHTAGLRNCCG